MDREKFMKNVTSHLMSALLAAFILMAFTQLWLLFSGDGGGEAVSWLTR